MAAVAASAPSVVVGYWKIRGLAQPIRTLLAYLSVPFADETYEQGDGPEFSREVWITAKAKLASEIDYVNLPYLLHGDVRITQSNAILRYIARTFGGDSGVYSGSPAELAAMDVALDQVCDMRGNIVRCAYGGMPFASLKTAVTPFLQGFEAVLAKHGKAFIAGGDKPTLADFCLWEMLSELQDMYAELTDAEDPLAGMPKLKALAASFEALPTVAAYLASDKFSKRPYNNKQAFWK